MKSGFSKQEISKFATRYDNGYDLTSDERYNAWLKEYHPEDYIKMNINKESAGIAKCLSFCYT